MNGVPHVVSDRLIPCDVSNRPKVLNIGRGRVPGNSRRTYRSDAHWALHLYFGSARFSIGSGSVVIAPGSVTLTPLGAESVYETSAPLDHIFVHLAPARPAAGAGTERVRLFPLHLAAGPEGDAVGRDIVGALEVFRLERRWAEIRLWDAVMTLARAGTTGQELQSGAQPPGDIRHLPIVERTMRYVDLHLPEPISLGVLAANERISSTHLNRLFNVAAGKSAMRYVRDRRMELAYYLLANTTLPVKEIAFQVGIPDVHAFNKLCKRYFERPPRAVRG